MQTCAFHRKTLAMLILISFSDTSKNQSKTNFPRFVYKEPVPWKSVIISRPLKSKIPSLRLCRCLRRWLVKNASELLSFDKQSKYEALGSLFRQLEYLAGKNISKTVLQANNEKRRASWDTQEHGGSGTRFHKISLCAPTISKSEGK